MNTASDHNSSPQNNLRFKAFIVFLFGMFVTAGISLFIYQILNERQEKTLQNLADEHIHLLARTYQKKVSILSPITGQIDFPSKRPSRAEVVEKLEAFKPLLSNLSEHDGYSFLSWLPVWSGVGEGRNFSVAALDEHKKATIDLIEKYSVRWNESRNRPTANQGLSFGIDYAPTKGMTYLVVAQPFFQEFNLTSDVKSEAQFPLGYLLGWLDFKKLLRSSWRDLNDPDVIVDLRYNDLGTQKNLTYQAGVIELGVNSYLQTALRNTKEIKFNLSGIDMSLRVLSLKKDALGIFAGLHWIVFVIGFLSSGLWCLLLLRMSSQPLVLEGGQAEFNRLNTTPRQSEESVLGEVVKMSKARWRFIAENLPVAVFAIDANGMFTLGEGKGLSILGLVPNEVEGNSIYEVFAQEPHLIDVIKECLSGEEKNQTVPLNKAWVKLRMSPIILEDGSFHGVIGVAVDVSEEHLAKDRLDKANLHLQGLMNNLPTGVAFVKDGFVQWCSRNLEETFGYKTGELVGRSPEILYGDVKDFRSVEENVRRKLDEGEVVGMKIRFRKHDGTFFQGEVSGRLVDKTTRLAGTLWVVRDLTQVMAQERERKLTKKVFDNVSEGVMTTDAHGIITSVNKAFSKITGYEEEEVLGASPSLLNSGRHTDEFYENMWRDLEEKGMWEGEIWNRRKGCENYLEWLIITSIRDENGEVEEYVSVMNDITKHRENQEQLNYQANYDQLTGLPNRNLLNDRFNQTAARAMREDIPFSLVYIDVDHFKFYNETLGHDVGDRILKKVADRISRSLRSSDTVARVSGDEFILLLVNTHGEEDASRAVSNLQNVLSEPFTILDHDEEVNLSASCGIAIYPVDGNTLAELTRKADSALYHAKEERGSFRFFTEDMNQRAKDRMMLENRLRKALERNEFDLFYQPKVDAHSGKIVGAEALIRWIDPEYGLIGPDRFIPVAEETGLIVPIGEWVFETACKQIKRWKEEGHSIENVAVNLSGRQFSQEGLCDHFKSIMERIGIEPHWIEIELTESFIASNQSGAFDVLKNLSDLGMQISVDDFGTGYSSLSYLHRFPLNNMKIDRSFVTEIDANESEISGNLAKAVIAIAQSMELKVIAEGVENNEQLEFLKENGCDLIQGFYFSRPVPSVDFEEMLANGIK